MRETTSPVQTTPPTRYHTKVRNSHLKEPVCAKYTFNTQYTPQTIGLRDQDLSAMGILDTGATGIFITTKYSKLAGLLTLGRSNKTIAVADNNAIHALYNTRIPYNLPPSAMWGDVVPSFSNLLIGVKPFADAVCISIFYSHQGEVTIHHQEYVHIKFLSPPIIKGVREEAGLWRVPLNNGTIPDGKRQHSTGKDKQLHTQTHKHT